MPPRSIPLVDCLTKQEIETTIPQLIAQLCSVIDDRSKFPVPVTMKPADFSGVCALYPPSASAPFAWWDPSNVQAGITATAVMTKFQSAMWQLVDWASRVYTARAKDDASPSSVPHAGARFAQPPIYSSSTIFEHESQLIHKLITYWIYYVRYRPSECKSEEDRLYEDVSHEGHGQSITTLKLKLIIAVRSCAQDLTLIAMLCECVLSFVSDSGRLPLSLLSTKMGAHCSILYFRHITGHYVPIHHLYRDDGCEWQVARCMYAPLNGCQRVMILHQHKIYEEDGFIVHNNLQRNGVMGSTTMQPHPIASVTAGEMYAFIGSQGDHPFTKSPHNYMHVDSDYLLGIFQSCDLPSELLEGLEEVIQEGVSSSSGSLFTLMQQLLRDEFPKPQQRIGVLVPRQPMEKQILELLLLEALKEEAEANTANESIAEIVHQIEGDAQATLSEIIHTNKRALMEQWIREQNAEHAEIVRRSQDRGSARPRESDVSAPNAAAVSSSASSSPQVLVTSVPLEASLQAVVDLLAHRRSKNRVVVTVLTRCLHMLSQHTPLTSIGKKGSHRTFHFKQFEPCTLVNVHGTKDSSVGRQFTTMIADRIMQMAVQMGLRC